MIYLLHFHSKLSHAQHYMGYTDNLNQRLQAHRSPTSRAPKIIQAFAAAGIPFSLVKTWVGDKAAERRLKNHNNAPRHCVLCNPKRFGVSLVNFEQHEAHENAI